MNGSDRLLTELFVTPIIVHAVGVLRAAVPRQYIQAGAKEMIVSLDEYGCGPRPYFEYHDWARQVPRENFQLIDAQRAAAGFLIGTAAFYEAQWRERCGIGQIDEDRAPIPPMFLALQRRFDEDVRRKLNIRIGGCFSDIDRYLHGSVVVYL